MSTTKRRLSLLLKVAVLVLVIFWVWRCRLLMPMLQVMKL